MEKEYLREGKRWLVQFLGQMLGSDLSQYETVAQ